MPHFRRKEKAFHHSPFEADSHPSPYLSEIKLETKTTTKPTPAGIKHKKASPSCTVWGACLTATKTKTMCPSKVLELSQYLYEYYSGILLTTVRGQCQEYWRRRFPETTHPRPVPTAKPLVVQIKAIDNRNTSYKIKKKN